MTKIRTRPKRAIRARRPDNPLARRLPLLCLILAIPPAAFAQDPGTPALADRVRGAGSTEELRLLIEESAERGLEDRGLAGAYARLGLMYELSGAFEPAAAAYDQAFRLGGRPEHLIRNAVLLVELGLPQEALEAAVSALDIAEDPADLAEVGLLLLRLAGAEPGEGADNDGPRSLYAALYLAAQAGLDEEAQSYRDRLVSEFPNSPEAALAGATETGRRVLAMPTPWRIITGMTAPGDQPQDQPEPEREDATPGDAASTDGEAPDTEAADSQPADPGAGDTAGEGRRGVQVGSFLVEQNAVDMLAMVTGHGYRGSISPSMHGDRTYFRVIIPIPDGSSSQTLILALKERGLEGFLVDL